MARKKRLPELQSPIYILMNLLKSVDVYHPDARLNIISMKTKNGRITY